MLALGKVYNVLVGKARTKRLIVFSFRLPKILVNFATKMVSLVYSLFFILSNLSLPNLTRDSTLDYSHPELGSEIPSFILSNLFLPNLTRERRLTSWHPKLD